MSVYPKCRHIQLALILGSLLGIVPSELMFSDRPRSQKAYAFYSNFILGFFVFCTAAHYVDLFNILTNEVVSIDALTAKLGILLIFSVTAARQFIFKLNPQFLRLLRSVISETDSPTDEELQKMSKKVAKSNQLQVVLYLLCILEVTIVLIIGASLKKPEEVLISNETVLVRALPGQPWLPFDEQTHPVWAFVCSSAALMVGSCFVNFTDVLLISLILYPVEELKSLQHIIKHFDKFRQMRATNTNDRSDGSATFIDIVRRHQAMIEYVQIFNDTLDLAMLVDFMQSSLHIAALMSHIILTEQTWLSFYMEFSHFLSMILRPFFYYNGANEVMFLSQKLVDATWEVHWYDQSRSVQKMVLFFIMRAHYKPLRFNIGPFAVMTLQSFISVLRFAYSYAMLLLTI